MSIQKSSLSLSALCPCAIILAVACAGASSAHAATANMTASATIVPLTTMAERSEIRFPSFVARATPRTITLAVPSVLPEDQPTSPIPTSRGGVGALQISGPASGSFGVSTEATTTLTSGDNSMTLNGIKLRYGANGTAGTVSGPGTLDTNGNGTIVVGGDLNVAAGQAAGSYSGSLTVWVNY